MDQGDYEMPRYSSSPLEALLAAEEREVDRRARKRLRKIFKGLPAGKQILIAAHHGMLQQGFIRIYLLRALKQLNLFGLYRQVEASKELTVNMLSTPSFRPVIGEAESETQIDANHLKQEMARAMVEFMEELDKDEQLLAWRRYHGWVQLNFVKVVLLVGDIAQMGLVGRLLIALRLSEGISQRELAERLGVHESDVSRDERNEYYGITIERANRVLTALGG